MKRHNLDEYSPGIFSDLHLGFYNDSKQNIHGSEETGDAKFLHFLSDKQQSISQQKKEFAHYMGKHKCEIPDQSAGDLNFPLQKPQWESEISIHCDPDKNYSWDDKAVITDGSDGDNFYKIFQSKAPKAEETASLLDQVVELRVELEERIKDLAIFKKEIHEVGKLMKIELFQTAGNDASRPEHQNINNHRHTAVLADRVLNSVQQTANKIQTLCTELDNESSPKL